MHHGLQVCLLRRSLERPKPLVEPVPVPGHLLRPAGRGANPVHATRHHQKQNRVARRSRMGKGVPMGDRRQRRRCRTGSRDGPRTTAVADMVRTRTCRPGASATQPLLRGPGLGSRRQPVLVRTFRGAFASCRHTGCGRSPVTVLQPLPRCGYRRRCKGFPLYPG